MHLCTCVSEEGGDGEAECSETSSLMCTCVSEEGGDGDDARSETPSLLSYILRDVSFVEVGRVCRVPLREPMHLSTYVSEEEVDGGTVCSETSSLLSYSLGTTFYYYESTKRNLKT
jgi:hypothetical protein